MIVCVHVVAAVLMLAPRNNAPVVVMLAVVPAPVTTLVAAEMPVTPELISCTVAMAVPGAPMLRTVTVHSNENGMAVPAAPVETAANTDVSAVVPAVPKRTVRVLTTAAVAVHVPRILIRNAAPAYSVLAGIWYAGVTYVSVVLMPAEDATIAAARAIGEAPTHAVPLENHSAPADANTTPVLLDAAGSVATDGNCSPFNTVRDTI